MASAVELRDWDAFYHPPLQTEEELLVVYEEQFPLSDFWEDHFNLGIMQQILDIKFNCHPSSEYVAEKESFQMSSYLKVKCKVCNCDLTRYTVLISHHDGKRHRKMYQSNLKRVDPCLELKVKLKSLDQRLEGFHPGTLEHLINVDPQPIVGVQFLYSQTRNSTRSYHCKLCTYCSHTKETMLAHLKSVYHIQSLFITKYRKNIPQSEVFAACKQVVRNEGKINYPIPVFSSPIWRHGKGNKEAEMSCKYLKVDSNAIQQKTRDVKVQKEFDPSLDLQLIRKVPMIYRTTERMDLSKCAFFMSYIFLSIKKLDHYYNTKRYDLEVEKMKKLFYYFFIVCKDMDFMPDIRMPGW